MNFALKKRGYIDKAFSYETHIDTPGIYKIEQTIERKRFLDIQVSGVCQDDEGKLLRGVEVDLMDKNMELFGSTTTDDAGEYFFRIKHEKNKYEPINIESDYSLHAKHKGIYESTAPDQDLMDSSKYTANFLFQKPSDVVMDIRVYDELTQRLIDGVKVIMIDNYTSANKEIVLNEGKYFLNLKDKRKGEKVSFQMQFSDKNYQTKTIEVALKVDKTGKILVKEYLNKKKFINLKMTGLVRTPQGERIRGVKIELMNDGIEILGSSYTDENGKYNFEARAEVEVGIPLEIEDELLDLCQI